MGIIMAAMALDTELSRLFGKWKEIDANRAGLPFDREAIDQQNYATQAEEITNLVSKQSRS